MVHLAIMEVEMHMAEMMVLNGAMTTPKIQNIEVQLMIF